MISLLSAVRSGTRIIEKNQIHNLRKIFYQILLLAPYHHGLSLTLSRYGSTIYYLIRKQMVFLYFLITFVIIRTYLWFAYQIIYVFPKCRINVAKHELIKQDRKIRYYTFIISRFQAILTYLAIIISYNTYCIRI